MDYRQESDKHIVKYWQGLLGRRNMPVTSHWARPRFPVKFERGLVLSARNTYGIWLINLLLLWISPSFCAGLAECQDWVLTDTRTYVRPNLLWGPGSRGIVRHQPTVTRSRRLCFAGWHCFLLEASLSYCCSVWLRDVLKVLLGY